MRKQRSRVAFTFADLLVVLFLLAVGVAATVGAVGRAREVDYRIACGKNLRTIAQALTLYASDNKGSYPRTRYDPDAGAWNAYTGWESPNPFGGDDDKSPKSPAVNDVTADLFLLLRTQEIKAEDFVCPSSSAYAWDFARAIEKDKAKAAAMTPLSRANFPSPAFLSYSYANAYPNKLVGLAGYRLNAAVDAKLAIAADMNPGGKALTALTANASKEQLRNGNSLNHNRNGQNVLYGDGHVEFALTPFAGANGDNIYTVSGSDDGQAPTSDTIVGSPRWKWDSVLLPTAEDKGDAKAEKLSPPPPGGKPAPAVPPDARITIARGQVAALNTALEVFEIDTGRFPTDKEGLAALMSKPAANLAGWHGPYIDARGAKELNDPWGNPYRYRAPGKHSPRGYDLWSNGPDGKEGGGDDLGNWK
jgi:general secretion pathway protein G